MTKHDEKQDCFDCMTWEVLLPEAMDGLLAEDELPLFEEHRLHCPACNALYEEAKRGQEWLEFLSPEPEIPAGLVDRILAQTGPGHQAAADLPAAYAGNVMPLGGWSPKPGFMGWLQRSMDSRLMMTAAMAFFSVALTLNLAGIRVSELKASDLKPENLRSLVERRVMAASTPIVRYYDHMRLVDQVQERMRDMRHEDELQQREAAPTEKQESQPGQTLHTEPRMVAPEATDLRASVEIPVVAAEILRVMTAQSSGTAHSGGDARSDWARSVAWTA